MGARNRVGIVLSTARQATRLADSIPRNRFLGSLKVKKYRLRARISKRLRTLGIDSQELIPPAYVALRVSINRVVVVVQARQAT